MVYRIHITNIGLTIACTKHDRIKTAIESMILQIVLC